MRAACNTYSSGHHATQMSQQEGKMKSLEAKVVVLGSQGVGKTSVVIRYVGGMFSKAVSPTIGASFFTYKLNLENYRVKLQVWDTAGQERFRSMVDGPDIGTVCMNRGGMARSRLLCSYRKANAAMLVYDISSSDSFYDIKDWVSELKRNVDTPIVLCLVGNKCDLEEGRKVPLIDAQEYAESIDALFFETSALKNTGIEEAFLEVAKKLIKLYETTPTSGLNILESSFHNAETDRPSSSIHVESSGQKSSHKESSSSVCAC